MNKTIAWGTFSFLGLISAVAGTARGQSGPPSAPAGFEARPTGTTGAPPILLTWNASPSATSYVVYRGTSAGGETSYAKSTTTSYLDSNVVAGPPTVYFYKVVAVGAGGTSAQSEEHETATPLPVSTGTGNVAGVTSGSGKVFYCSDGLRGGFDWFQKLKGWFPSLHSTSGSISPSGKVIDMAYASEGSLAFNNVMVSTAGLYTVDWRYAYASGLFGGVTNRHMGLMVNGTVVTSTQRFPITGSFSVYEHSALQVHLNAGQNSLIQLAVTDHGISRVDQMTVTPASASVPGAPTGVFATTSPGRVAIMWTGGSGAAAYQVYRGTKSDGEALTAIASTGAATTTFLDAVSSGKTYFYNVSATNGVGVSPDSNEIMVITQ